MKKNRCVLLIDGGWLLMSRFSVMSKDFSKELPNQAKSAAKENLKELLARSIINIINRFPCIDNLILTVEGGSWRKLLPVPDTLSNIQYKGNRSNTAELDWNYIYGAFNDLSDQFKSLGITTSYFQNAEGDDWIWYWSRRLNAEGSNCIIWSSDNDLKQLIQIDEDTRNFTVWYNDKNGLWLPSTIQPPVLTDELDFFFTQPEYTSDVLEVIKRRKKGKINYIDPNDIILEKVICGDSGDNIKSILRYEKNGRIYKITKNDWHKMKDALNINTIHELQEKQEDLVKLILNCKKYSAAHANGAALNEMITYNIKLVYLHDSQIPGTITSAMVNEEFKDFDISYIKNNFRALVKSKQSEDIQDIFDSFN